MFRCSADWIDSLDFPTVKSLIPANALLDELGYDFLRRLEIIEFLHRHGTAQCCSLLQEQHRGVVERLLPVAPDSQWDLSKFAGTWELGPERLPHDNILASA